MANVVNLANKVTEVFQYGEHQVTLETHEVARQATGAVMVRMGDTQLLATVVAQPAAQEGRDFFPLTVNYQERTYAAGKIPGGYFKREGRPTERETLICRLIDRPLRPLFPKAFKNEVQVIITVMSVDPRVNPDIPGIFGAAAALAISGVPFAGPVAAARVGYSNGEYLLNLSPAQVAASDLELIVAGTENAILMVESEAKVLSEEVMLGAILFGHQHMQVVINAIKAFAVKGGKAKWEWAAPVVDASLDKHVRSAGTAEIVAAYNIQEKMARYEAIKAAYGQVSVACVPADKPALAGDVKAILDTIAKETLRGRVMTGEPRVDGRDTRTVRPITIEMGTLARAHGSTLFTRGETQAIVVATLGTERDAQRLEGLLGEELDRFMLHYNFPPYCVGEVGMMSGPKRREIGHGRLAKRAMMAVLPDADSFPYVLRVVSEITESNGSSSMASVCGTSLALMDAGVPIAAPVAGIAMGLVKEGDQFAVLTDILGDEDHLGDMDFKVAGTSAGITALQMDIKIAGITKQILEAALAQAREGRLHILSEMEKALGKPRADISPHAPRITTIKIHPDKIRDVIGKGGVMIRQITEATGATIDISEDGLVKIAAVDGEGGAAAMEWIAKITADVEVGTIYEGVVMKMMDFGAFVEILPGKSGLLHISQIANERIEKVTDKLELNQKINVKVTEIDRQGRIRLSMKELQPNESMPESSVMVESQESV